MVSYTPRYSLPYVVGNDYVANYPNTVSKPLAERLEEEFESAENSLASIRDSAEANSTGLDELSTLVDQLNQTMTAVNGYVMNALAELTTGKTETIVSGYSSTDTEYFTVTRVGRVVTVEGSVKSNIDVPDSNTYINALYLPPWATVEIGRNNLTCATQVNTFDTNEFSIGYGRVVQNKLRLAGPFRPGDTVRCYVTYITGSDFNATASAADTPSALDKGEQQ